MKLNYKRTILIGFAFLSISAFWQMYDGIVPLILKNTFGIGETVTGTIMAADNVFALFLLPLFGSFSDKVNTPFGKRMPFVIVGTALATVLLIALGYANAAENLSAFVIILFFLLIAMGTYRSPAVALMPDLTPKPLRSKGNAVINLMGALGGVFTLAMIKVLVGPEDKPSYMPLFIAVALCMVISVAILALTIRENKLRAEMPAEDEVEAGEQYCEKDSETASVEPTIVPNAELKTTRKLPKDVKRSLIFILISISLWFTAYNAVTTAFSRYVNEVWGMEQGGYADCLMVATIAAIISYIPIGAIAGKIGRKKTILMGILLMSASYAAAGLMNQYHPLLVVGFGIIGFGWAAINVNSLPMVVEMSSSADVGKYTGLYYTFSMSAQVITPILSGFLLENVSYRTLFPYAVVFSMLSFLTMQMVKHGDTKPIAKKSVLENFDIDD